MSKAIQNADMIRAVLDGKTVQLRWPDGGWITYSAREAIGWLVSRTAPAARIKPEPVVRWVPIFDTISGISVIVGNTEAASNRAGQQCSTKEAALTALHPNDTALMRDGRHGKLLRLELDPDTLDVLSARTEAP